MDEQREILEKMITSGANYDDIVKQSQLLDKLIIQYYKGDI